MIRMQKPLNHWMNLAHPGIQYGSASDVNLMMAATRRSAADLAWENVLLVRGAPDLSAAVGSRRAPTMKKQSRKPGKASKAKANRDPGGSRINPDHEPNGAGIDVGAEFISVAVPEKCGEAPWVRDFDTFTGELEKAAR
jgi:hypothetical protein